MLFNDDKLFGVTEASESNTMGLDLRYEVKSGDTGMFEDLRERVFRNGDGNYLMAVNGGLNATFGFGFGYPLKGREVLIPITPEALRVWAEFKLYGQELENAMEEFESAPENITYEIVWKYQQGSICEFLWKTTDNLYMLFSTESDYPYPGYNAPYFEFSDDGSEVVRDDLYLYYVTPETAHRWAEVRGVEGRAWQEVPDHCA